MLRHTLAALLALLVVGGCSRSFVAPSLDGAVDASFDGSTQDGARADACVPSEEVCDDGTDGDCDGTIDEGCGARVVQLVSGGLHSCARRAEGTVSCWGSNASLQLGTGEGPDRPRAALVPGVSDAIHMASAGGHTCVVIEGGTVKCWGSNEHGQCGVAGGGLLDEATDVESLENVSSLGLGAMHSCAVLQDGGLVCWGSNGGGELGVGTIGGGGHAPQSVFALADVVQVAGGFRFTCARTNGGALYCWGVNYAGQLGLGDPSNDPRAAPARVTSLVDVVDFNAGGAHACAVIADGTVKCWGSNDYGQVGDGTNMTRRSPVDIGVEDGDDAALGNTFSCLLHANSAVSCWGPNDHGQLGDGTIKLRATPGAVMNLPDARTLAGGYGDLHMCAVRTNGDVLCWGGNTHGQIGNGGNSDSIAPTLVVGL